MMAWARYLMLVVFENFLQFFFRFLSFVFVCRTKKKKKNQIKDSTSTYDGATYCFSRTRTRYLYEALPAGRATRLAIGWPGRLVQRTIKGVARCARARVCVCVCVCVHARCGKGEE